MIWQALGLHSDANAGSQVEIELCYVDNFQVGLPWPRRKQVGKVPRSSSGLVSWPLGKNYLLRDLLCTLLLFHPQKKLQVVAVALLILGKEFNQTMPLSYLGIVDRDSYWKELDHIINNKTHDIRPLCSAVTTIRGSINSLQISDIVPTHRTVQTACC